MATSESPSRDVPCEFYGRCSFGIAEAELWLDSQYDVLEHLEDSVACLGAGLAVARIDLLGEIKGLIVVYLLRF